MTTSSTDQLEQDVRAMLAERAASVAADPATGESVIADRLRAGDAAVSAGVPLVARPSRRRWPLALAAAAAAVAVAAAIVVIRDDPDLTTGPAEEPPAPTGEPVIFTAPGDAETVARAYLSDRLDVAERAIELLPSGSIGAADAAGYDWTRTDVERPMGGFVGLLQRDGRWAVLEAFSDGPSIDTVERDGDSVTVHATGPAGSHVELSVHLLTGEAITAGGCGGEAVGPSGPIESQEPVGCSLVDEPIARAGDGPVTVRFSVVTGDGVRLSLEERLLVAPGEATPPPAADSTVGIGTNRDDSVKDVAEQLTLAVFGAEYVATDAQQFDGLWEVTLAGESDVLVASVAFDESIGRFKLFSLRDPDHAFEPRDVGGSLLATTPDGGHLTITHYGGTPGVDLSSAQVVVDTTLEDAGTEHGPYEVPERWLAMELVTEDGRVLRYFASAEWIPLSD